MKNFEKVIEILAEKIENLESEKLFAEYKIKDLQEEIARLNELLNPTKKENDDE